MNNRSSIEEQISKETPLSLLQKIVRMIDSRAPRLDQKGKSTIQTLAGKADMDVPDEDVTYLLNRASEKITDEIVHLVGNNNKENVVLKGAVLGLTAGVAAVMLPAQQQPIYDSPTIESHGDVKSKLMTVGVYVLGGIVASLIVKQVQKQHPTQPYQ